MSSSLNFVFRKSDCLVSPEVFLSTMLGPDEPIDKLVQASGEVVLPASMAGVTNIEYLGQKPQIVGDAAFNGLRVRLEPNSLLVVKFSSCQPAKGRGDIFIEKKWVIYS